RRRRSARRPRQERSRRLPGFALRHARRFEQRRADVLTPSARPGRQKRGRAARSLGTDANGFTRRPGRALLVRNGAGALRRGGGCDRIDLGAIRRRGAVDRGQPVESRIGLRARPDAQFSSPTASAGGGESESDEGGSLATGGVEGDEEPGDESSVLLGGICIGG